MAALLGLRDAASVQGDRSVETRLRVVQRVELARIEIASTAAELDCESERAEQAADYLSRRQTKSVQLLTIGSVAAAALTGIAGVFLSTRDAPATGQEVLAVSGGAVTAGLGLASLFVHARTRFDHPRNLLADIWTGPATSLTYPPFVWTYFTRAEFSNAQREAIRARIVARWRRFEEVGDARTAELLFGTGGSYDADTLRTRAAMLDEVRAEVELTQQDLAELAAAVLR